MSDRTECFEDWFKATFFGAKDDESQNLVQKANFNPNQPRDPRGEWTRYGYSSDHRPAILDIQYRGRYHDSVVDELYSLFEGEGSSVLRGVKIVTLNGVVAIPDLLVKPAGTSPAYFMEVKTGQDPKFTEAQTIAYPLICIGNHATSFDPRVQRMGLTPGKPFPPVDLYLFARERAGEKSYVGSYCKLMLFRR